MASNAMPCSPASAGCSLVVGHFTFTGDHAGILLGVLPPIVHLRKESDKAAMRWSLERIRLELLEQQPGGSWLRNTSRT